MLNRLLLAAALLTGTGAHAVTSEFDLLLDLDGRPHTGCSVATPAGSVEGIDRIVTTTVETDGVDAAEVTGVVSRQCQAGSTFGPPVTIDAGDWPVGVGNGLDGFNVVETFVPLAGQFEHDNIRIVVVATDELGNSDVLGEIAPGSGTPITIVGVPRIIPTLGTLGLIALALGLLLLGLLVMQRRGRLTLLSIVLLTGGGVAGATCVLDGEIFEWNMSDLLAQSAATDPQSGVDLKALFGKRTQNGDLCFRIDTALVFTLGPVAVDDDYIAVETTLLTVPAADGLLANDDLGVPPAVVDSFGGGDLGGGVGDHAAGTTVVIAPGGELTLNADGSLSFVAPAGYAGDFTFEYRIVNLQGSGQASVTVDVWSAPVAEDDALQVSAGDTLNVPAPGLLDNDDGNPPPVVISFGGGDAGGNADSHAAGDTITVGADGSLRVDADGGLVFTPASGFSGEFSFDYVIENDVATAQAEVVIEVQLAPTITSADTFTCAVSQPCEFTFTADGFPDPDISLDGDLPDGVTFDAASASLQGTPDAGSGAEWPLTVSADNGVAPEATQAFVLTVNEAPAITSADAFGCEVGEPCDFTFTADGFPAPEFDLPGLPAGLTLDETTGVLSGAPDSGTGDIYNLTLTADNGIVPADTQAFTLTIGQPPQITSADTFTCEVGQPCDFTFTADGFPAPEFELPGLPGGLALDETTGVLSGTPDAGTGAEHVLTLTAANGIAPDAEQVFTLTINEAPAITSGDSLDCEVGQPCDFTFTADGFPAPEFDLPGLPAGLMLDETTGVLSGTPAAGTGDVYNLTLTADNGIVPADTQAFTLTIGQAPEITSADNLTCEVGQPCDFTFTADGFPAPEFDLPGLPGSLSLDPVTGELSGIPDAGTGTVYNLVLSADNSVGADTQNFTLTINEAPAITSGDSLDCEVGQPCDFTFTADGFPAPEFDLPGLPAGLTLDETTGVLSGAPAAGTGDVYNLTLTADNGIVPADTQAFTLTIGQAPEITSADNLTCEVGQACAFTFTADGFPAPQFDLPGLPGSLSLDPVTGELSGIPDAGTGTVYNLVLSADNSVGADTQNFTLTINEAPAITSGDSLDCEVGQPCDFTFTADGFPAPEFDLPGLPAGLTLDETTGVLSGAPAAGTGDVYNLTLTADNGIVPADTQAFTLTIGQAPEITSADNLTCEVGQPCDLTFTADGFPAPEFDLPGLPAGLSLDTVSGVLSGTPDAGTGDAYNLTLTAANGIAPDATQAFALTINEAPAITSGDNLMCEVGQPCDFNFTATGFPAPQFDLPGLPAGLNLDPVSGVLSGAPAAGTGDVYNLTLTAANGIAPDATQAFTLAVGEPPQITSPDAFTCAVGSACEFTFTASGEPAPVISLAGTLPAGVSFNAGTASLEGTPNTGSGGLYPLTVEAANGFPPDAVQSFTLTINESPLAVDDPQGGIPGNSSPGSMPYHGALNAPLMVSAANGVLANDVLGFPEAAIADLNPPTAAGGSATLDPDGGFSYVPPTDFTGIDTFDYCLDNGQTPPSCAEVSVAIGVRPAADDATYPATLVGNVGIDTSVSTGFNLNPLTAGDMISLNLSGSTNGNGSLNPDGTFVFVPAAGFTGGNATLEFTVGNGFGNATGEVTLPVGADRIWFADNTAAAGDGRLGSPFNSLAALETAADASGDPLFLYSGSGAYTGGITLLNDQRLLGQGASQTLAAMTGVTPPADSVLPATGGAAPQITNGGGAGIALAADNRVQGLTVGNTSGAGIAGSSFGTLTISEVAITGSGMALNLDTGTIAGAGFTQVSSTAPGARNVYLVDVIGTLNLATGSLAGATTAALEIDGGSGDVTYGGSITTTGTARPVVVANRIGGTVTLSDNITGSGGIQLTANTGASIHFQGTLNLQTGTATAFEATGGGTITATAADNVLQSTTATALNVTNTTIGASGLTFRSISSNGGSATGIVLNNTGSAGGLTVTGDGTAGSGGTIANKSGPDAATVQGIGIYLNQTADVNLGHMQLNDFANYAILGQNVNGFELTDSVITGANGTHAGSEAGDMNTGVDQGSVRLMGLTGQALVTDSLIEGGLKDNFWVQNTGGTLNRIVFDNVTFGLHSTGDGNKNLRLVARGNANFNATVLDSHFEGTRGDQIDFRAESSGAADLEFIANTLVNAHPSIATGGGGVTLLGGQNGAMTLDFQGNTIRDAMGSAIVLVKVEGAGQIVGAITGNTIGIAGIANSGSLEGSGINVRTNGGGEMSVALMDNQVHQYNNYGINVQAGAGGVAGGVFNVNVLNNVIANPGNNAAVPNIFQGLHLNSGVTPGDDFQVCIDAQGNTMTDSGRNGGVDARLRQRQSTTVRLPGYAGGTTDVAAVQTYLLSRNVTPFSGQHAAVGAPGGGFVGGAACM